MGKVLARMPRFQDRVAKPLTKKGKEMLREKLYQWKDLMDRGKLDEADELVPGPISHTFNWADRDLEFLYALFLARYCRAREDAEGLEQVMGYINQMKHEFYDEHMHFYYRLIGAFAFEKRQFKEALKAFFKAEEIGRSKEWADCAFYYAIGNCLMYMRYSQRAIEYLQRAQELANERDYHLFDVYIQSMIAFEYGKMGQIDEALGLAKACVLLEKLKSNESSGMGFAYLTLGRIFLMKDNYAEALENIEYAFKYIPRDTGLYVRNVYTKALTLIAKGDIDNGVATIENCLASIKEDADYKEPWQALLYALKYSVSLDCPESLELLIEVYIPNLLVLDQYEEVVRYYKAVANYFHSIGDTEQALHYTNLLTKACELYINEKVEGAV